MQLHDPPVLMSSSSSWASNQRVPSASLEAPRVFWKPRAADGRADAWLALTSLCSARLVGLDEEPYCCRPFYRLVVSSAVLITDGVAAILGSPWFHPRQPFCGAVRVYGNTRVEQHPRMANCVYRRLRQAPILLPDWLSTAQPEPVWARGTPGARAFLFGAFSMALLPLLSRCHFISCVLCQAHAAGSVCEAVKQ